MMGPEDVMRDRYDSDGWDIWLELVEYLEEWKDVYLKYWGLGRFARPEYLEQDTWEWVRSADLQARLGAKLSLNLDGVSLEEQPRLTLKQLRRILRKSNNQRLVQDRINLELAGMALDQFGGSAYRAARLLNFVRGRLSVRASEFLSRAARLYVWGFEPECIIMCRSTLESALKNRLDQFLDPDTLEPSLDRLLEIAGKKGVLEGLECDRRFKKGWRARTDSPLWKAQEIKRAGNYVLHDLPSVKGEQELYIKDAYHAMQSLSFLLDVMFRDMSVEGH